uniref:Peptidase S9 prolyl oligopeptidase catalytic domain-containing protein n=1 Tax=Phlebotomus papatasi TaxID=29031 RepID=A0A1B0DNK4_PHLPP
MLTKLVQISLLLGILIAMASGEIERRNITQWQDHFDYNNTETWENTYYIDDSFYEPGGPIFLFMGGMDFYTTIGRLNSSHFRDIAEEVGAVLVGTEHRYYGESRPTPDLTKENLVYLTSAQALADAAELVRYLKASSPDLHDAQVIAAGIGHGGALASWMRLKYPELIDGAWASSAKVNAIVNFHEFLPNAAETIRIYGGLICYTRMANAFVMLEELFAEGNYTKLFEVFRMCPTEQEFDPELGGGLFFGTIATAIGMYISMLQKLIAYIRQ